MQDGPLHMVQGCPGGEAMRSRAASALPLPMRSVLVPKVQGVLQPQPGSRTLSVVSQSGAKSGTTTAATLVTSLSLDM